MAQSSPKEGYLVGKGYAYYVFILLFILYLIDYMDRLVVTALFPFMKTDLGLTDTQCGLLVAAVFWSVMAFAFPVSWLADRWSRKKAIALSGIFWSIAMGACALMKSFTSLFSARVVMGVGEAGYTAGGMAMISAYFPEEKRAQMMGIWNAAVPLGAVAGAILGGVIAEKLGWRHAFGIMAIPGLLVAGMFFTLRDYKTVELVKTVSGAAETAKKVKMKAGDIARDLMRNASLITTFLGYIGNVFVTTALLTWLPTYFYNMMETPDMSKAAMKSSLIFLFAIVGAPLGGVVTDLLRKKISNARMVVPAVSTLLTAVILFISTSLTTGDLQYNLLLGVGFFAPFFVAGAAAVTQDVVHPGLRSTAYGICIFVQNLLGASLGPIFVGAISDRWDLLTGLRFLPLFMLFGAAMFLIGAFFYNRDLGRVERLTLVAE